MSGIIVIPARWGSSRLKGKPLCMVAGATLLSRVVDLGRKAIAKHDGLDLIVATDNDRIQRHAEDLGCLVVQTDQSIGSGSSRTRAAIDRLAISPDFVMSLQGDAPFIDPATVSAVIVELERSRAAVEVVTPVMALGWEALDALRQRKRSTPFSGTTCIVSDDGRALWFSKAIIPAIRDEDALRSTCATSPVRQHIGLYGFTWAALQLFDAEPPSRYERLEGLEQLRLLERGMSIRVVTVPEQIIPMGGIDTREDVDYAEALIARHGDPMGR